jgi:hypothetical protein
MKLLRDACFSALDGVGDCRLGEWEEEGEIAYHVRRRLTEEEAIGVGPVVDVRNTGDAQRRFDRMRSHLPHGWTEIQ